MVNAQTEATQWPMPFREVVLDHVQGATVSFGSVSKCLLVSTFSRGTDNSCCTPHVRKCFRSSPNWVSTPRLRSDGARRFISVAYCQAAVQEIFQDMLYRGLLVWLDDLLGYAEDREKLQILLEEDLHSCQKTRLKLNPVQCEYFKTSI
jgi:hypothetical protein